MRMSRLPNSALTGILFATLFSRSITAIVVSATDSYNVFARDTCAGRAGLTSCGQGLPSDFCCVIGNTCIPLNNTGQQGAAICCPSGSDCTSINPITCDVSLQDATKFPQLPLHITDTTATLPTCGKGCCPLGYDCVDGNQCSMKKATQQFPSSAASSSTTSATSSPSTSTPASSSATSSPLAIQPNQSSGKKTNTAGLVFAGLIPGMIIGALAALGVLFFVKRRREKKEYGNDSTSSFFGPPTPHTKQPQISVPIYQPGMSDRVVFHNRSISGNTIPPEDTAKYNGGYYKPGQKRLTTDSATLVSPGQNGQPARKLDAPFETPTRPGRTAQQGPVRALFSKSPSIRSAGSQRYRKQVGKSSGSMETINMLMDTPQVASSQRTPDVRQTTYSDVYRAAGISPSKVSTVRPSVDTQRR